MSTNEERNRQTPEKLLMAANKVDELIELTRQKADLMVRLKKAYQWGVFRPAMFSSEGSWSVILTGSISDIRTLGIEVKYANGTKENIPLSELPIELWPLQSLPPEYHPRLPGTRHGPCWKKGCGNVLSSWVNSEDDKYYCERCAREGNFQNPGKFSQQRVSTNSTQSFVGRATAGGVQQIIKKMNLITLAQLVEKTKNNYKTNNEDDE